MIKEVTKKRVCWNCEGSVSLNEEVCPFCGVSVIPASLDGTDHGFVPPYMPHSLKGTEAAHPSPYRPWNEESVKETSKEVEEEPKLGTDDFKKVVASTTLLLAGSVFFLFGLALVLFSTDGTFSLKWDGSLWYVYLIFSVPLIYFGWKYLMEIDD